MSNITFATCWYNFKSKFPSSVYEAWHETYYTQLQNYLDNNYLVKDDQIVIVDCVFSNIDKFQLYREYETSFTANMTGSVY